MTHEILLTFFQQFIDQEAGTIERIGRIKDDLFVDQKTGALVFSLASLHKLLFDQQKLSFSEFKQTLYQGHFNQSLQAFGGAVSVYQSHGKIDDNLYQLKVLDKKYT